MKNIIYILVSVIFYSCTIIKKQYCFTGKVTVGDKNITEENYPLKSKILVNTEKDTVELYTDSEGNFSFRLRKINTMDTIVIYVIPIENKHIEVESENFSYKKFLCKNNLFTYHLDYSISQYIFRLSCVYEEQDIIEN